MSFAPSVPRLHSSFISCPLKFSDSRCSKTNIRLESPTSYPCIRALDLDQNTVVAISVGVASVAIGIGIPVFYETQIDNAAKRDNTQPCFPCNGSGAQKCRFCLGSGSVTVELGADEREISRCINCEGVGSLTCTTCQGSGIQPRYLDRRGSAEFSINLHSSKLENRELRGLSVERSAVAERVTELDAESNADEKMKWTISFNLGSHSVEET